MNARERMQAALSGQPVDRVPFFPCIYMDYACRAIGRDYKQALIDPRVGAHAMLAAARACGSDVVRVRVLPPATWYRQKEVVQDGTELVQRDRGSGQVDGRFDIDGGGKLIPSHPPPPIASVEAALARPYRTADELLVDGSLDTARQIVDTAHADGMFVVGMAGGQSINEVVATLGDAAAAMIGFLDEPDLVHAIIRNATDATIEVGAAFAEIGVDALYIGDSYASGSVISPAIYRTFCAPAYARAAAAAHARGLLVYKHCCGNYDPLLSVLRDEPLDGMEGIDPTSGMDVGRTRAALAERMTLIGGVSCLTLLNGSAAAVAAESAACIAAGGRTGRFVLGSACAVPPATPPENLEAMGDAARGAVA
jgi:uroporphyrinogen-III decarboxylase